MIINEAKTELTGNYTCKAKNEFGETKSSANVTVNYKPKFGKKMPDQKCNEGDTLKLTVTVKGEPDPDLKWLKDGKDLTSDTRVLITRDNQRKENYDLTLTVLKGTDGGVYEVKATNECGSVSSKCRVSVLS